ncbi:hypothetical protein M8J77_002626 [Diaphorina citri]|nr:hypothetical protein M8J77_002626 [Diaphorina citri]
MTLFDDEDVKPKSEPQQNSKSNNSVQQSPQACITMNLPRFYKPDPHIYFINVESQFSLAGITSDKEKFTYLTAKLEPEVLAEVSEVIRDASKHSYVAIKSAILKRFSQSEEQRLNALLGTMDVGDRTPSQMLREIQRLAGEDVPENIIRGIWLKKLPTFTQQIVQAVSLTTPLTQQADVADKVMSVNNGNISAVSPLPPNTSHDTQLAELTKGLDQLEKTVQSFMNRGRSLTPRRPDRKQSPSNNKYCHIHYRYGSNARNCAKPATCQFNSDHMAGNAKPSLN